MEIMSISSYESPMRTCVVMGPYGVMGPHGGTGRARARATSGDSGRDAATGAAGRRGMLAGAVGRGRGATAVARPRDRERVAVRRGRGAARAGTGVKTGFQGRSGMRMGQEPVAASERPWRASWGMQGGCLPGVRSRASCLSDRAMPVGRAPFPEARLAEINI